MKGYVCSHQPLQGLSLYCIEKKWDKPGWKISTIVYRLGKYVTTNNRSPPQTGWNRQDSFVSHEEPVGGQARTCGGAQSSQGPSCILWFLSPSLVHWISSPHFSPHDHKIVVLPTVRVAFQTGRSGKDAGRKKALPSRGVFPFILEGSASLGIST